MIIIVDIKNMTVESHMTLAAACRYNKWMRYQYLRDLKLSHELLKYKHVYISKT